MMLYCEDRYQVVNQKDSISIYCLLLGMSSDFSEILGISMGESVLLNVKDAFYKISFIKYPS